MIVGLFLVATSCAISASKAPTTAAELGSNGASAGNAAFQKLAGEKKRNGAVGGAGTLGSVGAVGVTGTTGGTATGGTASAGVVEVTGGTGALDVTGADGAIGVIGVTGANGEDGRTGVEPEGFRALRSIAFAFLTAHALRALRCSWRRAAAAHLALREATLPPRSSRFDERANVSCCEGAAAGAPEGSASAASATAPALNSTAIGTQSRNMRWTLIMCAWAGCASFEGHRRGHPRLRG